MPHFRTLREMQMAREDDIRGATLYGVNGEKLGNMVDAVFDHSTGTLHYAVVDTGGWLNHRKFLVPADRIHSYERDPDAFQVDMVKKHVERLPPFERQLLETPDDWRDYEKHYREWVTTGDVIHRPESTHVVTPEPEELPGEPIAQGSGPAGQRRRLDLTPRRLATGEVSAPTAMPVPDDSTSTSHAVLPRSSRAARPIGSLPETQAPSLAAGRWARFQERLRSRCRETTGACPECERQRRVA